MIDEKVIENIHAYGVYHESHAERAKFLFQDLGFKVDQKAEFLILGGCLPPTGIPQAFRALKNLFDRYQISYSLLSKEYCCGWMPLGQPAVIAKNEADIAKSKELSASFIQENFKSAQALESKSIVLFCAACEPTYSNYRSETKVEIISSSSLLDRFFQGGKLIGEVDFYAGCYRFRRRITSVPLDVEPALRVLGKIEGLKVNHLDNSLCCYIPSHMENLKKTLKTNTVVTICTGCYHSLRRALGDQGDHQVKMLPEVVWESVQ